MVNQVLNTLLLRSGPSRQYYLVFLRFSEQTVAWHFSELKGYLRYKTITSQNVSPDAQVKNFFIS